MVLFDDCGCQNQNCSNGRDQSVKMKQAAVKNRGNNTVEISLSSDFVSTDNPFATPPSSPVTRSSSIFVTGQPPSVKVNLLEIYKERKLELATPAGHLPTLPFSRGTVVSYQQYEYQWSNRKKV